MGILAKVHQQILDG